MSVMAETSQSATGLQNLTAAADMTAAFKESLFVNGQVPRPQVEP